MGARERGRKQNARNATRNPNSIPHGGSNSNHSGRILESTQAQSLQGWNNLSQIHSSPHGGFSLSDEARNTERNGASWSTGKSLRSVGISFVSAGSLTRDDPETVVDAPIDEEAKKDTGRKVEKEVLLESGHERSTSAVEGPATCTNIQTSETVFVDSIQRLQLDVDTSSPQIPASRQRSNSSTSGGSDDVIVFAGRRRDKDRATSVRNGLNAQETTPAVTKISAGMEEAISGQQIQSEDDPDVPGATSRIQPLKSSPAPRRAKHRVPKWRRTYLNVDEEENEQDALMRDYIENMAASEDDEDNLEDILVEGEQAAQSAFRKTEHFRFFDGLGEEKVKVQTHDPRRSHHRPQLHDDLVWSSGDLDDFNELSTTDEEIANIGQVLRKRQRPSGIQYLVTAVGRGTSDAKWLPEDRMTSGTAKEEMKIYEEIRATDHGEEADEQLLSTSDGDDEQLLNDLVRDIESKDAENAQTINRVSKMTDEQIARALTKQEEMGLASDEVLLFDGREGGDEFARGDEFISFSTSKHTSNRMRSKKNKRAADHFPSAEAFADALDQDPYVAFDVMDFDRPSLRPKRKGRKSDFPFDLEDEDQEIAEQLRESWSNDRAKKAARKQEREEMRMAGLLGSKAGNDRVDLHTKYANSGMDADQIRAEIRRFLTQEIDALALAPMTAPMRASVHRLAKALGLKSHSQGKADARFPILTKTPGTPQYSVFTINEIDALLHQRRFFPHPNGSFNPSRSGTPRLGQKTRRGGGGALAGASYMDGEIVGASAPEIGADNRGRAMLEKMGWASGMGIGKEGNKGSTEVIKHVVKNTKAGLR